MSDEAFYAALRHTYLNTVPQVGELGLELIRVDREAAAARLPCRPEFIGDTERKLIHTGVIATLIDSVSGLALLAHIGKPIRIATLDLRMDYLRPSRPGKDLICSAECYRLTGQIAFVRATAWQDDPVAPVAYSLGAFMLTALSGKPNDRSVLL